MNSLLFLGIGAGIMIIGAMRNSAKVKRALKHYSSRTKYLPQAISMLVLSSQISELLRAIEHVSIVNVVAALFLLAIIAATTSGTESELR